MTYHFKCQIIDRWFIWPALICIPESRDDYGSISLAWLNIEIGFCWSR